MTLPPENEDNDDQEHQQQQQGIEAQHICRPIIHSSISQGSYAAELERKITQLEQVIDELENEKEVILRQQSYKDDDIQMLKKELQIKDDIVSQLEQDFIDLEDKLAVMQNVRIILPFNQLASLFTLGYLGFGSKGPRRIVFL